MQEEYIILPAICGHQVYEYHEIDVHGNTVLWQQPFSVCAMADVCKWIKFVYAKQLKATGKDPASIYGRRDQKS